MAQQEQYTKDFKGDVTQLTWQLKLFVSALKLLERISPTVAAHLMLEKFLTPRRKRESDYTAELPAGARRIEIFYNMVKLTGWEWGGDGPSVLLVHGWEGHTGRMLPLVRPLLEQGYRVFALDAPGHGFSPVAKTHLVDVGRAIQAMIEQHGPFYCIIGHSFGASAASIMLARNPQLMPERLVLLSPMRDIQQHFDIFASVAQLSPKLRAKVRALAPGRVGMEFEQVSTIDAVRTFIVPGLVIHDRHDTLIPYEGGALIAQNWRGSQFFSTDKLGHRRGLRNAVVQQAILDFLAKESFMLYELDQLYKRASAY